MNISKYTVQSTPVEWLGQNFIHVSKILVLGVTWLYHKLSLTHGFHMCRFGVETGRQATPVFSLEWVPRFGP
uniref:Uncharacterized protein n=1 Tax=Anguilla anguilla TaxID=7936 RepID=A0A0E9VHS0_ANGAN